MRPTATMLCLPIVLALPLHAPAQERIAPAAGCLDARAMTEMRQASSRTLLVRGQEGRRFRIDLGTDCPDAGETASVLAAGGWVCGGGDEYVRTAEGQCPVAAVAEIDAREYALLARPASRDMHTLDPLEVREARPRGFAASHSFCFNPRYMRAWSEDAQGVLVEVAPKRSGGNRYYRVEFAGACQHLAGAGGIAFRSGLGIGVICGNPGDVAVAVDTSRPEEGLLARSPPSRIPCRVLAVYPDRAGAGGGLD